MEAPKSRVAPATAVAAVAVLTAGASLALLARSALVAKKSKYVPPKVWSPPTDVKHVFATNRATAGAQKEQELPRGKHALQLYSLGTPNGVKVTVLLEELFDTLGAAAIDYDAWLISIRGDQFGSGFVAANPNSKIPALLHYREGGTGEEPVRVFETASIMMYICEQFDREGVFLPTDVALRAECLSWVFWAHGSAPFLGGGFGHFYNYAHEKQKYPIDRYAMEAKRQLDVLDRHLGGLDGVKGNGCSGGPYLCGEHYTIADMAVWPWYGVLVLGRLYSAKEFLDVESYTHVMKWAKLVESRPAVKRGRMVNRAWGDKAEQLRNRHSAEDFETKTEAALEAAAAAAGEATAK